MKNESEDDAVDDNSPTDELPVLTDVDAVEDFDQTALFGAVDNDDTGRFATAGTDEQRRAPRQPERGDGPAGGGKATQPQEEPDAGSGQPASALAARLAEASARLADRDATIASLEERLEATRKAVARHEEAERRLQAELAERDAQLRSLTERDEAGETPAAARDGDGAALQRSREEAAALASYIEGRRAHWKAMEQRLREQQTRITELEHEAAQRAARERSSSALADAEARRVRELKSEIARLRALLDSRAPAPPAPPPPERREPSPADDGDRPAGGHAGGREPEPEADRLAQRLADGIAELRDVGAGLRRVEALLAAGTQAPPAGQRPDDQADDGSARPAGRSRRRRRGRGRGKKRAARPVLICLTSDPPREYRLSKSVMTVGRHAECDIQIATHFVSRQHARLELAAEGVLIEDLGSRNGVFVNSVRAERAALSDGDLLTIGETQFRFRAS